MGGSFLTEKILKSVTMRYSSGKQATENTISRSRVGQDNVLTGGKVPFVGKKKVNKSKIILEFFLTHNFSLPIIVPSLVILNTQSPFMNSFPVSVINTLTEATYRTRSYVSQSSMEEDRAAVALSSHIAARVRK